MSRRDPYDFNSSIVASNSTLSAKRDGAWLPETHKGQEFSFRLHGDWQDQKLKLDDVDVTFQLICLSVR